MFATAIHGKLLTDASLADYTAWRIGGPADYLYLPANVSDLCAFLASVPTDMPITWLGLGSNVLVRDGGIRGVVVVTQACLHTLNMETATTLRAEAGVSCATLARFAARAGVAGLEFMAGIPGTIGGALAMNAGCYGGETWQYVTAVETVDRHGKLRLRRADDYAPTYRHVVRPVGEAWFVGAHFAGQAGSRETSLAIIREMLAKRNAAQPTGLPNCGSVFRNPPDDHAARLIEACGLKGFTIGGAAVSIKHANFIINQGTASAIDVENLIQHIQKVVQDRYAVSLIPEVCILGEGDKA